MTKEEFADIMLDQLKKWSKFIDLDDQLPWEGLDEEEIFDLVDYVNQEAED